MKREHIKRLKKIVIILVLALCIGLVIYLFPIIKNIATPEGQAEFKEMIKQSGIKGVLILFGLELAQVLLVILPGEPLEIIAGMCYGGLWGTIFLLISVFIITTIIFYTVRKFGREFIYHAFDKEKVEKLEKSKWFKNPKNIEYVLVILFMIPGTAKDLLVYIGGLLPIKPIKFILISTFARFPSIISSTLAGSSIIEGRWIMMLIVYVVPLVIAGMIIGILKYLEKNKNEIKEK